MHFPRENRFQYNEWRQKCTRPKFNSSPLKHDGWKMSFLLGLANFRGYVQFQGCTFQRYEQANPGNAYDFPDVLGVTELGSVIDDHTLNGS